MNDPALPRVDASDLTSIHVRRALEGDAESRTWIVEHFAPLLHLQASHRLRGAARRLYDPEDLVQEVWAIALPRMPHLAARDGRWTPVLVSFLSTTLLHRVNKALMRALRVERRIHRDGSGERASDELEKVPDEVRNIVSRVSIRELSLKLRECIETLSERDREILVLRGIEQLSTREVAESLGEKPDTVYMRFRRALDRLKQAFPASVFSELS